MNSKQKCVLGMTVIASTFVMGIANADSFKKVDKPYSPETTAPVAPEKSADEVIQANPMTTLVADKSVAAQLRKIATDAGWELSWEVNDFQLDSNVAISTDIVKAVEAIIQSANMGSLKLRADFYRGNNFIRVTEL